MDTIAAWTQARIAFARKECPTPVIKLAATAQCSGPTSLEPVALGAARPSEPDAALPALKSSSFLLAALVDNAPIAMAVWDKDGRTVLANDAMTKLFGSLPPPDYSIRRDSVAKHLGNHEQIERAFAGELVTLPTFWYDPRELTEVTVTEGRRVAVSASLVPLFDNANMVTHVAGMFRDDTDVMLAQERLRADTERLEQRVGERTAELAAANRELEAFSYSVSHDLRTPLRAIDGYAARLMADPQSQLSADGAEYLQRVRNSAQRMSDLINDLLTFARFGRQALNMTTVDTTQLVQQVLEDLEPQFVGRRIELKQNSLPTAQADPTLLREVFLNLIDNAVKFTGQREHAQIEIGCQTERTPHVWYVRDNGVGFDMDHAGQLFGVFTRLHSAQDFEGTGVGLALVQRIVQRHGGEIWAEAAPDRGATFYFTLNY